MAKESNTRAVSKGICNFCKGEFGKAGMTQHLKSCKQRLSDIAEESTEAESTTKSKTRKLQKTKIFHLLVEGLYLPMYWMHLELPASMTLRHLDYFLRDTWLECCGHLSEFKIDNVRYLVHLEDDFDDEADELEDQVGELSVEERFQLAKLLPPDLPPELRNLLTLGEPVTLLSVFQLERQFTSKGGSLISAGAPNSLLNLLESAGLLTFSVPSPRVIKERGMGIELEKVLKPGLKFFHDYDFGSTTYLNLKVVAEREGRVKKGKKAIEVLARNVPSAIPCSACGKPATYISTESDDALCDTCVEEHEGDYKYEMLLPVVNSPRMGVCGYTGRD